MSADKRNFGVQLGRSLTSNALRPLIVAFDNVDRRESAQQLQIFQAAQWFRRETHAFTLLTLRDVTFERFKDQPPLDAFAPHWREHVDVGRPDYYVRARIFEHWRGLLKSVGMDTAEAAELISGSNNQPLYWLAFAARHPMRVATFG